MQTASCFAAAILLAAGVASGTGLDFQREIDAAYHAGGGRTAAEKTRVVPEFPESYPESRMFKCMLPAYGLYVRHVDGIRLEDTAFSLREGDSDERDAVVFDDVSQTGGRAGEVRL